MTIERLPGEPAIWFRRFEHYRLMSPKRSVAAVFNLEPTKKDEKARGNAPGRWYTIAQQWQWEERALAWDANVFAEEEESRVRIMRSGYALQHQRIHSIAKLADKLIEMTDDESKVWIPDVKSVGSGPDAERVDLVRFNVDLFNVISKYLADIASEMGERVKKRDTSIKAMPSNVYVGYDADQDGVDK